MPIEGKSSLQRKLQSLAKCTPVSKLRQIGEKRMAVHVEAEAFRLCPVYEGPDHTGGLLRASITTQSTETPEGVEIRTGTNMEYAEFVEYGTGRRGEAAGIEHPDDYVYGDVPGMAPQPYIRPAWDSGKAQVEAGIVRDLQKEIKRAVK